LNPRTLIPATIIGAVISLAIGYTVASMKVGGAFSFMIWAGLDSKYSADLGRADDAMAWVIGGAIVGAAAAFMWRPNSN
jgi:hypothetical protein